MSFHRSAPVAPAVATGLLAVALSLAACAHKPSPVTTASAAGTCSAGTLFLTPGSVAAGGSVHATATAHCSPGSYPVKLSVVGQFSAAWTLGTLKTTPSGTLAGTLHIPVRVMPGYARAYVVANFSCTAGSKDCSAGAAGTVTVLPARTS